MRPAPACDMRVKLFTFRYSATLGGFDDEPLQSFLRDKEVLSFREHFFAVNDVPHLVCVLSWQDRVVSAGDLELARDAMRSASERGPSAGRRGARADPAGVLSESDRVLYNTLREWRSSQAREDGVPPYVIFNNRELVELVVRKPDSPTALSNVNGIGKKKVERYGSLVLAVLHGAARETSRSPEPSPP